jgi:hypothetical protein
MPGPADPVGRLAALLDDVRHCRWVPAQGWAFGRSNSFPRADTAEFRSFTGEVEAILGEAPCGTLWDTGGTLWDRCARAFMATQEPGWRIAAVSDLIGVLPRETSRAEAWPALRRSADTLPDGERGAFLTWLAFRFSAPAGSGLPPAQDPATPALDPPPPAPESLPAEGLGDLLLLAAEAPGADWTWYLPDGRPRGPRFLWRAIEVIMSAEAGAAADPESSQQRNRADRIAVRLAGTTLTAQERAAVVAELRRRPAAVRRAALGLSLRAGTEPLLEPLDAQAAGPLLRILRDGTATSPDPEARALDLAEVRAAIAALGEARTMDLLPVLATVRCGSVSELEKEHITEVIGAACAPDRARLARRFGNHAQGAIAALGAAGLADGETVEGRYLQLRWSMAQASRFGSQRQVSHRLAVRAGLAHLAQVAGYPSAGRMEWDLEARLAARDAAPGRAWEAAGYRITVECRGADALLSVHRGERQLKSVPGPLRKQAAYADAREAQERLRDQARRVRTGLVEPLVAGGELLPEQDFASLLRIPAARAMLGELVLRTGDGRFGLLVLPEAGPSGENAPDAPGDLRLAGLDGQAWPLRGPVGAAHPWHLAAAGMLGGWQREIVRRRLRQPVKQAFRELYVLTPAELQTEVYTARFAGHAVTGAVAAKLLGARGWLVRDRSYDDIVAMRACGELDAVLDFDQHGHYLGERDAVTGVLRFARRNGGGEVSLAGVDPLAFSEALRDIDLVVCVAATAADDQRPYSVSTVEARAALAATLAAELGLRQVTVGGQYAHIRGARAAYRVHLGSGSVHTEPGGHLCIVPAGTAGTSGELYLPFADEDRVTSLIISKILLLADDVSITDPAILRQIQR